jgi:hypothetical protein
MTIRGERSLNGKGIFVDIITINLFLAVEETGARVKRERERERERAYNRGVVRKRIQ